MLRKKTFESLSQKKTKKILSEKGSTEGSMKKKKTRRTTVLISICLKKTSFDQSGGIEIGIEKNLKQIRLIERNRDNPSVLALQLEIGRASCRERV